MRFSEYCKTLARLNQAEGVLGQQVLINDKDKQVYDGDATIALDVFQSLHFPDYCQGMCRR